MSKRGMRRRHGPGGWDRTGNAYDPDALEQALKEMEEDVSDDASDLVPYKGHNVPHDAEATVRAQAQAEAQITSHTGGRIHDGPRPQRRTPAGSSASSRA